ncbi:MAG: SAM-dependent methyltransferase [Bacillota bacterium]
MNIEVIAEVRNEYDKPVGPEAMEGIISEIVVKGEYVDGLYKIEENDYLVIVFSFHLHDDYDLIGERRYGGERGVFSSRSPRRPGSIGVTTVELISREGNVLTVKGLDAVNGTPVLDIKPFAENYDCP